MIPNAPIVARYLLFHQPLRKNMPTPLQAKHPLHRQRNDTHLALSLQISFMLPLTPLDARSKASKSARDLSSPENQLHFNCPRLFESGTRSPTRAIVPSQATTEFREIPSARHTVSPEPGKPTSAQYLPPVVHDGCGFLSRFERRTIVAINAPADMTRLRIS